jgi:hypothetical protein
MRKTLVVIVTAALSGCVAGDEDSFICVDWKADGINACDTDGEQPPPPSPPPPPCELISDAVAIPMVEGGYTVGSTEWAGSGKSRFTWTPAFPPQWTAQGGGGQNTPSTLESVSGDLGQHTLTVANAATTPGDYLWIQADGADYVELSLEPDAWPATRIDLHDGSAYWYAPSSGFGDASALVWNLSGAGAFTVRGNVNLLGRATLAGPGGGSMVPTVDGSADGSRSWLPVSANCYSPYTGADDTAGTPEPEPDASTGEPTPETPPGTFDPCLVLGYGPTTWQPAGYSPAWERTDDDYGARMNPVWWGLTMPYGIRWWWTDAEEAEPPMDGGIGVLTGWRSMVVAAPSEAPVAAWLMVESVDPATSVEDLAVAFNGSPATIVPTGDGDGGIAVVEWDLIMSGVWTGVQADARGWAQDDASGVQASTGTSLKQTVHAIHAWMPAAGYCLMADDGPALDESGGG